MGFLFGSKDTPWTQEELARKREIADALTANSLRMPKNGWEGARAIVDALGARKTNKKIAAREGELRGDFDAKFNNLFAGGSGFGSSGGGYSGGSGYTPPPPPSQFNLGTDVSPEAAAKNAAARGTWDGPIDAMKPEMFTTMGDGGGAAGGYSMGEDVKPADPIAAGIVDTATALGIDPVDLATAISYETAGTFDPMKAGPTTQWGQHKGLIQFGEPQAQQYGVDWNDPVGSQLGPDGAVAKYLTGAGVKPGMGMMDIYSAINAGSVGRYGASDANNGGAPGTVADKVNNQMAGHRAKAEALLQGGGSAGGPRVDPLMFGKMSDPQQPQAQPAQGQPAPNFSMGGGMAGGMDFGTLAALAASPYASPEQKAVLNQLIQQQTQAMDPMYQMQLEQQRLELEAMKSPKAGMRPMSPDEMAQWGIPPNSGSWGVGPDGTPVQIAEAPQGPKPTADMQEYEFAKSQGFQGSFTDYQTALKKAGASNTTVSLGADESELKKALGKKEGELWSGYLEAGATAASAEQDMLALDEIIKVAPQGPVSGRLAEMFPGFSSAGDAFQSIVKRVAPTLRAPGSGSTSDIEYDGMLKSLPKLSNTPEANVAIAGLMKAKAALNKERAAIVAAYQNGEFGPNGDAEARRRMAELDSRSIMTPEIRAALGLDAEPAQPQADVPPVPEGVDPTDWEFMTPEERALFQ